MPVSCGRDWITEVRRHRGGNHADPETTHLAEHRGVGVGLERRDLIVGEGWTVHVYAEVVGAAHEVLRIDCFDRLPHFHRGWSQRDEAVWEEPMEDPWAWGMGVMEDELRALGLWDPALRALAERLRREAGG